MSKSNKDKLIITKNESLNIKVDNNIIPIFSSPVYLKKKILTNKNKYNFIKKYELINKFLKKNNRSYFNDNIINKNLKYKDNSRQYNNIDFELQLANNIISNEEVIKKNIFIKDYFYYKVLFLEIGDKSWVALRVTENKNKYGYSKIYKAVLFEENYLNFTLKWKKIKELNWIDLYFFEKNGDNKNEESDGYFEYNYNQLCEKSNYLQKLIECDDEFILYHSHFFKNRIIENRFKLFDKIKNIIFPGTIDMQSINLDVDRKYRKHIHNKIKPIFRIFIENINGKFKFNYNKIFLVINGNYIRINKEEYNLKYKLKEIILPNKIFFLKNFSPFIEFEEINNKIYIDYYSDSNKNTIEKDNLFKDSYLKYLYFKKNFNKYTQGELTRVSSTFFCLNLVNYSHDFNSQTDIYVFIHLNHDTGLIDNFLEVPKDFMISLIKAGKNKEEIKFIIQNLYLIFIETGKINNSDFFKYKNFKGSIPIHNKKNLDAERLSNYITCLNKLNLKKIKFYSTIDYSDISKSFADNLKSYFEFNLSKDNIFIPINLKYKESYIKVPTLILDFYFVFNTTLTKNWNIKTMIKNFNQLSQSRKNKIFKDAYYTQYLKIINKNIK